MTTLYLLKKKAIISAYVFLISLTIVSQNETNNTEISLSEDSVVHFFHEENDGPDSGKENFAKHITDGDLTTKWAGKCPESVYANRTGDDVIIKLGGTYDLAELQYVTLNKAYLFQIYISTTVTEDYNNATFSKVSPSDDTHLSSNTDGSWKTFDLGSNPGTTFVKIKNFGRTDSQWNTILEVKLYKKGSVASVESNELRQVSLYPTPTNNQLHIKNFNNVVSKIEVFNVLGKKLISNALENNKQTIDTSSLANGMYLVKLTSLNNESSSKMIVIQH